VVEVDLAGGEVEEDDGRQQQVEDQGQGAARREPCRERPAPLREDADRDRGDDRRGYQQDGDG
jgi:hypothetical protein